MWDVYLLNLDLKRVLRSDFDSLIWYIKTCLGLKLVCMIWILHMYVIYDCMFRSEISFYDLNLFIYMIYDCMHDLKIILR